MADMLVEEDEFDFDKWEQDDLEFQRELDQLNNELDLTLMSMDLYDDLVDLISNTNKKIDLLKGLQHEAIREQFLIDLFLSEAMSIFEGFVSSYLVMFKNNLNLIDHSLHDAIKVFGRIHFKGEKTIKGLLSEKSRKTLNNPANVHLLFSKIFSMNFEIPYTKRITKEFLKDCITIRNAHIHNDGIHNKEPRTLSDVIDLISFYVEYLNNLNNSLLLIIDKKLPKSES